MGESYCTTVYTIVVTRSGLDNKQKYIRQENMLGLSVFEFAGSAQSCLDSAQSCQDSARDITQGLTRDLLLKVFYTEKLISRE